MHFFSLFAKGAAAAVLGISAFLGFGPHGGTGSTTPPRGEWNASSTSEHMPPGWNNASGTKPFMGSTTPPGIRKHIEEMNEGSGTPKVGSTTMGHKDDEGRGEYGSSTASTTPPHRGPWWQFLLK